jgi:acetoin utilization deacetylase AcuC-like enzyme
MTPPLYFDHPVCLEHDPRAQMPTHPDTPERLYAIEVALQARDWLGWERRQASAASERELELVHDASHVGAIR